MSLQGEQLSPPVLCCKIIHLCAAKCIFPFKIKLVELIYCISQRLPEAVGVLRDSLSLRELYLCLEMNVLNALLTWERCSTRSTFKRQVVCESAYCTGESEPNRVQTSRAERHNTRGLMTAVCSSDLYCSLLRCSSFFLLSLQCL